MEFITKNNQETIKVGQDMALKLKGGEVFALVGDLGTGKTTFVQGLAKGLGIKQRVTSPTFIIMRKYELKTSFARRPLTRLKFLDSFYHVDLYRLEHDIGREVVNLGLPEILGKKDSIVAIEWADKIKNLLPKNTVWISFITENSGYHKILTQA